jgi:hypothetical protein
MKDIVITRAQIRLEGQRFGLCVLGAFLMNALSIIYFQTHWVELVTTLPITFALAGVLYLFSIVFRSMRWLFYLFKSRSG